MRQSQWKQRLWTKESSGAADAAGDGVEAQIINNPTIVNQYGEKNVHIEHVDNLKL